MQLRDNPIEFEQHTESNDPEIMVQLIDISKKIFVDMLSMERQQMALMNSTVSHEMRNPLNSLQVQTEIIHENIMMLVKLQVPIRKMLQFHDKLQLDKIFETLGKSIKISISSCKLLKFNIEDMLALPQLKQGKFNKVVERFDADAAIQEIMSMQEYQCKQRNVKIDKTFIGFRGEKFVNMDEKRFQQVLLNY